MPFMNDTWLSPEEKKQREAEELAKMQQQEMFLADWENRFQSYQQMVTPPAPKKTEITHPTDDPSRQAFREQGFTQPLEEVRPVTTEFVDRISPVETAQRIMETGDITAREAERKVWDRPAGIDTRTGVDPVGRTWSEQWGSKIGEKHGSIAGQAAAVAGHAAFSVANLIAGFEDTLKHTTGFGHRVGSGLISSIQTVMGWDEETTPESLQALDRFHDKMIQQFEDPSREFIPGVTFGRETKAHWEEFHRRAQLYDEKEGLGTFGAGLVMEGLHTASEVASLILQMSLVGKLGAAAPMGKYTSGIGKLMPGVSQAQPAISKSLRGQGLFARMHETLSQGITATQKMPAAQRQQIFQRMQRLGVHGVLATPGDYQERIESASYRLAYNMTPYIANATGLTGLKAAGTDVILNSILTSPMYGKAWHEAGGPTADFWSFAIPQMAMDVFMARGTRGLAEMGQWEARQERIRAVAEDRGISEERAESHVRFVEQALEQGERAQGERFDPIDYKQYTDINIVPPMPTEREFGLSPRATLETETVRTMADPEARLTPERLQDAEFEFRGLPVRPEDVELAARSFDPADREHIHFKHVDTGREGIVTARTVKADETGRPTATVRYDDDPDRAVTARLSELRYRPQAVEPDRVEQERLEQVEDRLTMETVDRYAEDPQHRLRVEEAETGRKGTIERRHPESSMVDLRFDDTPIALDIGPDVRDISGLRLLEVREEARDRTEPAPVAEARVTEDMVTRAAETEDRLRVVDGAGRPGTVTGKKFRKGNRLTIRFDDQEKSTIVDVDDLRLAPERPPEIRDEVRLVETPEERPPAEPVTERPPAVAGIERDPARKQLTIEERLIPGIDDIGSETKELIQMILPKEMGLQRYDWDKKAFVVSEQSRGEWDESHRTLGAAIKFFEEMERGETVSVPKGQMPERDKLIDNLSKQLEVRDFAEDPLYAEEALGILRDADRIFTALSDTARAQPETVTEAVRAEKTTDRVDEAIDKPYKAPKAMKAPSNHEMDAARTTNQATKHKLVRDPLLKQLKEADRAVVLSETDKILDAATKYGIKIDLNIKDFMNKSKEALMKEAQAAARSHGAPALGHPERLMGKIDIDHMSAQMVKFALEYNFGALKGDPLTPRHLHEMGHLYLELMKVGEARHYKDIFDMIKAEDDSRTAKHIDEEIVNRLGDAAVMVGTKRGHKEFAADEMGEARTPWARLVRDFKGWVQKFIKDVGKPFLKIRQQLKPILGENHPWFIQTDRFSRGEWDKAFQSYRDAMLKRKKSVQSTTHHAIDTSGNVTTLPGTIIMEHRPERVIESTGITQPAFKVERRSGYRNPWFVVDERRPDMMFGSYKTEDEAYNRMARFAEQQRKHNIMGLTPETVRVVQPEQTVYVEDLAREGRTPEILSAVGIHMRGYDDTLTFTRSSVDNADRILSEVNRMDLDRLMGPATEEVKEANNLAALHLSPYDLTSDRYGQIMPEILRMSHQGMDTRMIARRINMPAENVDELLNKWMTIPMEIRNQADPLAEHRWYVDYALEMGYRVPQEVMGEYGYRREGMMLTGVIGEYERDFEALIPHLTREEEQTLRDSMMTRRQQDNLTPEEREVAERVLDEFGQTLDVSKASAVAHKLKDHVGPEYSVNRANEENEIRAQEYRNLSEKYAPIFYTEMKEVAETRLPDKGAREQVENLLRKHLRPDEIRETEIIGHLREKYPNPKDTVPRDFILEHAKKFDAELNDMRILVDTDKNRQELEEVRNIIKRRVRDELAQERAEMTDLEIKVIDHYERHDEIIGPIISRYEDRIKRAEERGDYLQGAKLYAEQQHEAREALDRADPNIMKQEDRLHDLKGTYQAKVEEIEKEEFSKKAQIIPSTELYAGTQRVPNTEHLFGKDLKNAPYFVAELVYPRALRETDLPEGYTINRELVPPTLDRYRYYIESPQGQQFGKGDSRYEAMQKFYQAFGVEDAPEKLDPQHGHFRSANELMFVRGSIRTNEEGGKSLIVEQLQSDVHGITKQPAREYLPGVPDRGPVIKDREGHTVRQFPRGEVPFEGPFTIPPMPFEKTWPELGMKWAMRFAAENNIRDIYWTSANQQARVAGGSRDKFDIIYEKGLVKPINRLANKKGWGFQVEQGSWYDSQKPRIAELDRDVAERTTDTIYNRLSDDQRQVLKEGLRASREAELEDLREGRAPRDTIDEVMGGYDRTIGKVERGEPLDRTDIDIIRTTDELGFIRTLSDQTEAMSDFRSTLKRDPSLATLDHDYYKISLTDKAMEDILNRGQPFFSYEGRDFFEDAKKRYEKLAKDLAKLPKKDVKAIEQTPTEDPGKEVTPKPSPDRVEEPTLQERFSREQAAEIKSEQKKLQKILDHESEFGPLRPEYKQAIEAVFDAVDWKVTTQRTDKKMKQLADIKKFIDREPMHILPQKIMKDLERMDKKPLSEFRFEEVMSMFTAAKSLARTNFLKQQFILGKKYSNVQKMINHAAEDIRQAHNLIEDADRFQHELSGVQSRTKPGRIQNVTSWFKESALLPENLAITLQGRDISILEGPDKQGPIKRILYDGINQGATDRYQVFYDAQDHARAVIEKHLGSLEEVVPQSKHFVSSKRKLDLRKIKLTPHPTTGKPRNLELTRDQMMELYAHSKNPFNRRNLAHKDGGIRFEGDEKSPPFVLRPEDLKIIVESMPRADQKIVDDIFKYVNTTLRQKGNEVSVRMDGFEVFDEKAYWPINRWSKDLHPEGLPSGPRAHFNRYVLEEMGILQDRAYQIDPVLIKGFWGSYFKYMDEMSRYTGYAEPLRNAKMMLDDRDFIAAMSESGRMPYYEVLKGYLQDVEGNVRDMTSVEKFARKTLDHIHRNILGFNVGVMLKQPTSYLAAGTEISMKYLTKAAPTRIATAIKEMNKYSPQNRYRREGKITREMSEIGEMGQVLQFFTGKTFMSRKVTEGIKFFDAQTVGRVWNATKMEIKDRYPDLKGDDFFKKVAERHEEIINRTQPTYLPHTRSEIGRSPNIFVRLFSPFHTQRNKNYNIMYKKLWKFANSEKKASDYGELFQMALLMMIASPMYLTSVDELRDKLYNRHVHRTTGRKAWEQFSYIIGNAYAVGGIADTVYGQMAGDSRRGYDIAMADPYAATMMELTEAISATGDWINAVVAPEAYETGLKEGDLQTGTKFMRAMDNTLVAAGKFTGLPYANVKRLTKGSISNAFPNTEIKMHSITRNPQSSYYYGKFWEQLDMGDEQGAANTLNILIDDFNITQDRLKQSAIRRELDRETYEKALEIARQRRN